MEQYKQNNVTISYAHPSPNARIIGYWIRSEYPIKYAEGSREQQWVRDYNALVGTIRDISKQIKSAQIFFEGKITKNQIKELTDIIRGD